MEDRVLAKLQIKDKKFEIWVDCEKAMLIKNGKSNDVNSALLVEKVFRDARKGDVAGDLNRYFDTDDIYKIAGEIVKRGEIQLSSSYRDKQVSLLKNRIIDEITSMAIDSTTNIPIPRKRIELAMENVHYNFDLNKPEKEQEIEIVEKLKKTLPLKIGELSFVAETTALYANDALSVIKRLGSLKSSERNDSNVTAYFSVKAGNKDELVSKLKGITHGNVNIKEMK